jgi:anti-sigma regulatory factor (Ser/Thr protein kinase)
VSQSCRETAVARVPAHARHVGELRRLTGLVLTGWGLHEDDVYVVQLLVSEIATNAIEHGGGESISFALSYVGGEVLGEIGDGSVEQPVLRPKDPDGEREHGRGMAIVSDLARWGTSDGGKTTWFRFSAAGAAGRARP